MSNTSRKDMGVRLLKALFKYGGQLSEGTLSAYVKERLAHPDFGAALAELEKSGLVEVSPSGHGRTRQVSLTKSGNAAAKAALLSRNEQARADIAATAAE